MKKERSTVLLLLCCFLFIGMHVSAQTTTTAKKKPVAKTNSKPGAAKTSSVASPSTTNTDKKVDSLSTAMSKEVKKPVANSTNPPVAIKQQAATTIALKEEKKPPVPEKPARTVPVNPFARGTINFVTTQKFGGGFFNDYMGTVKASTHQKIDPVLDFNYFLINNLAIGVEARYYLYRTKRGNTLDKNTQYNLNFYLVYGHQITDKVGLYLKGGYGFGKANSIISANGNKTEFDISSYSGLIGAPILLNPTSYLTPYFTYGETKTKFPGNIITDKNYTVGLRLESYINPQLPPRKSNPAYLSRRYLKGNSFIDFATRGNLSFNTRNQTSNGTLTAPIKTNYTNFSVGGAYYFIDYLAGGLAIRYTKSKMKVAGSSDGTISNLLFQPFVLYHPLQQGGLKNLFAEVAYGIGPGNQYGLKSTETELDLMAGVNLFLSENISFTPLVGWQHTGHKPKGTSSGIPSSTSGFIAQLGFRAWLKW